MAKRCSVKLTSRELIESKLLVALSDKDNVGCIFDCRDVTALIEALRGYPFKSEHQVSLLHDLLELRFAAFDVPRRD